MDGYAAADRRTWRYFTDSHSAPGDSAEKEAESLDTAFQRAATEALSQASPHLRSHPSAASSPILRWLLTQERSVAHSTASTSGAAATATMPTERSVAAPPTTRPPPTAVAALARRGIAMKDPLQKRLLAKQRASQSTASLPTNAENGKGGTAPSSTTMAVAFASPSPSHWSKHPFSAMTPVSWHVFRQQLGIVVELVSPSTIGTSAVSLMPAADQLPAIRCWAEARLPLSLGLCMAHRYGLPTAIQSQCVPLAMLACPVRCKQLQLAAKAGATASGMPPSTSSSSAVRSPLTETAVPWSIGMDILAVAETGSGKTIAYVVPLLFHILCRTPRLLHHAEWISYGPLGLIMVPTRELAEQVTTVLQEICGQRPAAAGLTRKAIEEWEVAEAIAPLPDELWTGRNRLSELRIVKVVGGEDRQAQYHALAEGAHVVVGTVGQLHALLEDRYLSLGNTSFVVMDEADRMLDDSGSSDEDKARLVAVLQRCPSLRQTVMFTATLNAACRHVARQYFSSSGYYTVHTPYRCASIRQNFEMMSSRSPAAAEKSDQQQQQRRTLSRRVHPQKFSRLVSWLVYATAPVIIFVNEKAMCDVLWEELRAEAEHLDAQQEFFSLEDLVGEAPEGLTFRETADCHRGAAPGQRRNPSLLQLTSVAVVHAELTQAERRSLIEKFQRGQRRVLITTDLLARGLDVAGVSLVINYDVPWRQRRGAPGRGQRHRPADTGDANGNAASEDAVALYVHRIGRTGRAGSTGVSVTFVVLPALMVQRAEESVRTTSNDAGQRGGTGAVTGVSRNGSGPYRRQLNGNDEEDVEALLYDGGAQSLLRGVTEDQQSSSNRRRGRDADLSLSDDYSEGDHSEEDNENEVGADATGVPRRRRRRGDPPASDANVDTAFSTDEEVLRPLWRFLVQCVEENMDDGQQRGDGAALLRRGGYPKICISPALALIMDELSRSSRYGRITV